MWVTGCGVLVNGKVDSLFKADASLQIANTGLATVRSITTLTLLFYYWLEDYGERGTKAVLKTGWAIVSNFTPAGKALSITIDVAVGVLDLFKLW